MNLTDLFSSTLTKKVGEEISSKIGIDELTTHSILNSILPKLLSQVSKNASTEDGVRILDSAIEKGHNTSNLDLNLEDGAKILSHIMGKNTSEFVSKLSNNSGLDLDKSSKLLSLASSYIMENLGKVKNEGNLDLSEIMKIGASFLDKDGDGNMIDDLFDVGKNFFLK